MSVKKKQLDKLTPQQKILLISRSLDRCKSSTTLGQMAIASLIGLGFTKEELLAVVDDNIVLDDWLDETAEKAIESLQKKQEETQQSIINN